MASNPYKKIFKEHNNVLRASQAVKLGVPRYLLYEMAKSGELVREGQGIYRLRESASLGNPDLVQISLRIPKAVICLISALYLHELTTQVPHAVYFALPYGIKTPKIHYPSIRVFHFSEESHKAGIMDFEVDGIKVKAYSREKTIADCFKFREKVGLDIALEALKDYIRQPKLNTSLLLKYAKINRVEKVMSPYLEALL